MVDRGEGPQKGAPRGSRKRGQQNRPSPWSEDGLFESPQISFPNGRLPRFQGNPLARRRGENPVGSAGSERIFNWMPTFFYQKKSFGARANAGKAFCCGPGRQSAKIVGVDSPGSVKIMVRKIPEESGGSDIDHIAGRRIRQARQNAGMTLETLASQAGISKALLSKIENSKVSSPLATFSKISKVLGVPLSDLLKEEEQIKYLVVRKGDKKPALGRNTPQGFVTRPWVPGGPKSWNPFLITYTPVEKVRFPGPELRGRGVRLRPGGGLGFTSGPEVRTGSRDSFVDGSLPTAAGRGWKPAWPFHPVPARLGGAGGAGLHPPLFDCS